MATAASTASRARWLRALRWPTFRRVWSAATLQQFGYWFSSIALQWLAGVLADVRDRRRILLSTQLAILLISTTTAVLAHLGRAPVWTLMAAGGLAIGAGVLIVASGSAGSLSVYGVLGPVSIVVLRRPGAARPRSGRRAGVKERGSGRAGRTPAATRRPGSRWRRSR